MSRPADSGLIALAFGSMLSACGAARPTVDGSERGAIDPRRLFPLEPGTVYSYMVRDGTELPTLATLRVLEASGDRVTIQRNRQPEEVLVVSAEGIALLAEPAWLVRAPIVVGATFPAEGGRTARVASIGEEVRTGLGEHRGCVRIDERDEESRIETQTTYCPDIGPVRIVSSLVSELSGVRLEVRAELIGRVQAEASDTRY